MSRIRGQKVLFCFVFLKIGIVEHVWLLMGSMKKRGERDEGKYLWDLSQLHNFSVLGASLVALLVKNLPAGDLGSIPGWGRCPGEENGNPLQCSCLDNSMDRGAWWATVHGVSKSDTTEWLSMVLSPYQVPDIALKFLHVHYCTPTQKKL